jgi:HK97 family phage portal protein
LSWFSRFKEKRSDASANDPIEAEHWIVQRTGNSPQSLQGDGALQIVAVFACVRVLSETIASLPLMIYERLDNGTKQPVRDHPLVSLLHTVGPNDIQTPFEFFEMGMGHQCLRGNSYAFIDRTVAGRINKLIPIHPDRCKIKLDNGNREQRVVYELVDEKGTQEVFEARDIWHLKGLSSNGYEGISPVGTAKNALVLTDEAERHGIGYYQNGARASGIAKHPGILKEDASKRLSDSINRAMSGGNKYKVVVFEQGMEWQNMTLSNEDSQYLETRNFQVAEIARLFRVPLLLIQHQDKAPTYASAEQFMLSFVTHTIRPWVVRLEQSINKYLLSASDRKRMFAKFKIDGLLRGDTKTRYEAYASAITSRWMNPNEVRDLEDMNPREGGDEYLNPAVDPSKQGGPNNAGNNEPT